MHLQRRTYIAIIFSAVLSGMTFSAHPSSEKLVFAVDLIRHGDRTPIQDLPTTPYDWPQGMGQLTPIGMQQEYRLGLAMRARYIQRYGLLPEHYQVSTTYICSSDVDRTLMSAQSLLAGLYPLGTGPRLVTQQPALPAAQQPIPIHTLSGAQHKLLYIDLSSPTDRQLIEKYVLTRPDWKAKTVALQPNFKRWSELTGVQIQSLREIQHIADALYIRQLYHLPLPKGMHETEAKTIIDAGRWAMATLFKPAEVGQAVGGRLLKQMRQDLSLGRTSAIKWKLYSAHDSTLLALMSAMQVPLDQPPHYASDLSFQLFQVDEQHYRVRIILNGKPVLLPKCRKTACTLSEFPGQ